MKNVADSGRLCAGVASVDITPPVGIAMCGYGARTEGALGIHDPLRARVVVLSDGRTSLAIVSADLVDLYSNRVIAEARRRWGVDHVVLCGTHTHSGPVLDESAWYSSMEEKVIMAIGEAATGRFPARIGAGMGAVEGSCFGYNRRLVGTDGKVTMLWSNPGRRPVGPTDPTVRVLRIEDETGAPRAVMVHYACHAVTLGQDNRMISADFPGPMVEHMEKELGNGCMAMFLQGAGGDVHPYDAVMSGEAGFRAVRENGICLAKSALRIADRIKPSGSPSPAAIQIRESVLEFQFRSDDAKRVQSGIMAALIHDDIALAVIPYEPFVQHQIDLVKRSPVRHTFVLGYAHFGKGVWLSTYLPTVQAVKEGGYGAALGSANVLEIGAGERMVDEAVASINLLVAAQESRGRLRKAEA